MKFAGVASLAIEGLLRTADFTWRTEILGLERVRRLRAGGEPFVYTLWHGRMLLPIWAHRGEGVATMASRSSDGEIIARWLERNGYAVARGSSTRGGARALLKLISLMESGRPAALTVDGPKGPPCIVQPGVVTLVRKMDAWVLPISAAASKPRHYRSWDSFLAPQLFSRNVVVHGEPFRLHDESDDGAVAKIAGAIDAATDEAEKRVKDSSAV